VTPARVRFTETARPGPGPTSSAPVRAAIVILGGLITSTLLNLFVLPALYLRFGRARARATAGVPVPQPVAGD
jgi:predicted RND superfamily exporter protein